MMLNDGNGTRSGNAIAPKPRTRRQRMVIFLANWVLPPLLVLGPMIWASGGTLSLPLKAGLAMFLVWFVVQGVNLLRRR